LKDSYLLTYSSNVCKKKIETLVLVFWFYFSFIYLLLNSWNQTKNTERYDWPYNRNIYCRYTLR